MLPQIVFKTCIKILLNVFLKTGEVAYIVEIYEDGVAYEADIDKIDGSIETETIEQKDIERVIT